MMKALFGCALATLASTSSARFAGVQDVDSYPKYGVTFLNALPVANETAEAWLQQGGVIGGEAEFIAPSNSKRIAGGEIVQPSDTDASARVQPVQRMRFGSASYVCLIPPPQQLRQPSEEYEPAPEAAKTWELLQPLSGRCLYHQQGWFTYSYCHGQHVRQFRQLQEQATFTFPPVARVPDEDPEYPSYTLGKSAQAEDGSVSEAANRLELARGTGQRYLHFRWGDGTACDRTGKPREIEVQFHCSMTVTDTIVFVKETRTCEYTLVIHTPRLCSEPGFRRVLDDLPAQQIRCREVLPAGVQPEVKSIAPPESQTTNTAGDVVVGQPKTTPVTDLTIGSRHPKQFKPRPITRLPVRVQQPDPKNAKKAGSVLEDNASLRKMLESLLGLDIKSGKSDTTGKGGAAGSAGQNDADADGEDVATDDENLVAALGDVPVYNVQKRKTEDGQTVIEFEVDQNELDGMYDDDGYAEDDYTDVDYADEPAEQAAGEQKFNLVDALRAAGYEVLFDQGKGKPAKEKDEGKDKKKGKADSPASGKQQRRAGGDRDEL